MITSHLIKPGLTPKRWANCDQEIPPKHRQQSLGELAYRLADDGGTIQAGDMLQLTSDPRKHTTTSLTSALLMLGCKKAE
jgi:hypothetical protein